jgi:type VI secretion system secreted protein Hcp
MTRSRLFKLALPAAVALGAGTAVAIAAIPSTSGQIIKACYQTAPANARTLRLIDADNAAETCAAGEATLTWNQQGPTGPVGPVGPQGDPGPPGDSGSGGSGSGSGGSGGTGGSSPFDPSQAGGPTADIFLALDGIPGDSTNEQHKNEIAIESFAFLAKRTTTSKAVRFSGLRLDKVYDVSSPRLFAAATSGRHIKSAVVTFSTSSDPSGIDVVTYKLSDVTLTSYEQGGVNPDTKPLGSLEEEISLNPAKVQVTEKTFGADGKPGPVVTANWTVPKAKR